MSEEDVTREEFQEWLSHPVTRVFFNHIKEERDGVADKILKGHLLGEGVDQDRAVIIVQVYDAILNAEFDDNE